MRCHTTIVQWYRLYAWLGIATYYVCSTGYTASCGGSFELAPIGTAAAQARARPCIVIAAGRPRKRKKAR